MYFGNGMKVVSIVVAASAVVVFGLDNHSLFMNSLSDSKYYDKRIRPYHMNSTLNITVYMTIVSFGDVEEMRSEFSLDMFFDQTWHDPRLRHNESGNITLTGLDRNLIWLPDTFFTNIKNAQHHTVPADNSRVFVSPLGQAHYSTRITMSASCEMDLHEYPLDTQTCMLQIMSYAYGQDEIDYYWKGDKHTAIKIMNDNLAQLALDDFQVDKRTQKFGKEPFAELLAIFRFKRRLGYSLLQIYAPTFLIVCLSWLSFWISKDAIPARVALGITTILTIVTLNGSFRSAVPKVSYIKAMDLYLIVSFFFVFGAVMEYIAVLSYVDFIKHRQALAKKQDMDTDCDEKYEDEPPKAEIIESTMATSGSKDSFSRSYDVNKQSRKPIEMFKMILSVNSTPIDKISKVAFPLCYVIFNIVYWLYYGLNETTADNYI